MYVLKRRDVNNMNSKEFKKALELLEERGMDREYIYEAMVLALTSAYKKNTGLSNVRVEVDRDKNEFPYPHTCVL